MLALILLFAVGSYFFHFSSCYSYIFSIFHNNNDNDDDDDVKFDFLELVEVLTDLRWMQTGESAAAAAGEMILAWRWSTMADWIGVMLIAPYTRLVYTCGIR